MAFANYIADGHLERHVRKLKREYRDKSLLMEEELQKKGFEFFLNEAYLSYLVHLPNVDQKKFKELAEQRGIGLPEFDEGWMEISFASLDEDSIADSIEQFDQLVKESTLS